MEKIKKNQFLILVSLAFALLGAIYAFPLRASSGARSDLLRDLQTRQGALQAYADRGGDLPNEERIRSTGDVRAQYTMCLSDALRFLKEREVGATVAEGICIADNVRHFPNVQPGNSYAQNFRRYYNTAVQKLLDAVRTGNARLFDVIGEESSDHFSRYVAPAGASPWFACLAPDGGGGGQADLAAFSFETWNEDEYPRNEEIPTLQWKFWIQKELVGAFRDGGVRRLVSIRFEGGGDGRGRQPPCEASLAGGEYNESVSLRVEAQIFFRDVPRLVREVLLCRRNFLIRELGVHSLEATRQMERDALRRPGPEGLLDSPVTVTMRIEDLHYRWSPDKEPQ
ncbi:MAG: hypothetical protein HY608_03120 [Planctomycetes bacterium]|nr:hypothetical protein [Planctomycetota bacterium]